MEKIHDFLNGLCQLLGDVLEEQLQQVKNEI